MTEKLTKRLNPPAAREPPHLDDILDEALEETFPASDPIAIRVECRPTDPAPEDRSGLRASLT
jgi:hypothetical protein